VFPSPGIDDAGGDRQDSMDERDLDVAVTVGAPLDEWQGGQERSASAKCSPAAAGGCGVLFMGRAPSRGSIKARSSCSSTRLAAKVVDLRLGNSWATRRSREARAHQRCQRRNPLRHNGIHAHQRLPTLCE
jgi:hypothetical protein